MARGRKTGAINKNQSNRKVEIDWDLVKELCSKNMTGTYIANLFGIHRSRLYDRCLSDHKMSFIQFRANARKKTDLIILESVDKLIKKGNTEIIKNELSNRFNYTDVGTCEIDFSDCKSLSDQADKVREAMSHNQISSYTAKQMIDAISRSAEIKKQEQYIDKFKDVMSVLITAIDKNDLTMLDQVKDTMQSMLDK